jgi:hypothetical protein
MKRISAIMIIGMALFLGMSTAQARPHTIVTHKHVHVDRKVVVRPAPVRAVVNQLTSTRRVTLPRDHIRIIHTGNTYYYHNGVYYIQERDGYVVVNPTPSLHKVTIIKRG